MRYKQQDFQTLVSEVLNHKPPVEEEEVVVSWRVVGETTTGKKIDEIVPARTEEFAKKGMYDAARIFGYEIKELTVEPYTPKE